MYDTLMTSLTISCNVIQRWPAVWSTWQTWSTFSWLSLLWSRASACCKNFRMHQKHHQKAFVLETNGALDFQLWNLVIVLFLISVELDGYFFVVRNTYASTMSLTSFSAYLSPSMIFSSIIYVVLAEERSSDITSHKKQVLSMVRKYLWDLSLSQTLSTHNYGTNLFHKPCTYFMLSIKIHFCP